MSTPQPPEWPAFVDEDTELTPALAAEVLGLRTPYYESMTERLARRLEWATGRNGDTLLGLIRREGLDVIEVTPEQEHP
jgi:hypothetical protein